MKITPTCAGTKIDARLFKSGETIPNCWFSLFLLTRHYLENLLQNTNSSNQDKYNKGGGTPGLVVMGGDSCSEGRGFNPSAIYWMVITFFVERDCNVCLKRRK